MRGRRRRGGSGLAGLVLSLFLSLSIFLLLFSTVTAHGGQNAQQQQQQQQQSAHAHRHIPFEYGDELKIDCITPDANGTVYVDQHGEPIYGPGPTCQETGESWTFHYGVEQIIVCRWLIDQALYNFLRMVIAGQATYRCRLRMSKDGMIYMPYPISIWGGVEPQHIHVMNHYSWNFHAAEGYLVGAAAFPLRDHFQLIEPGATLTIHGPVKWFEGHTYEPLQVVRKAKIGESDSKPVADAAQGAPPADGQGAPNQDAGTPTSPSPAPAAPPVVAPRGPEIPLKPEANTNELSTRACVKGYGFYEPLIVALYCLITSIATAGICFLIYLSYIKSEGASAGRKAK